MVRLSIPDKLYGREYDVSQLQGLLVTAMTGTPVLCTVSGYSGIGTGRQRKTGTLAPALFWSVGVLTFVNAAIAAIWR